MVPNIPVEYLNSTKVNTGGIFDFADGIFDASRINAIVRIIVDENQTGGGDANL